MKNILLLLSILIVFLIENIVTFQFNSIVYNHIRRKAYKNDNNNLKLSSNNNDLPLPILREDFPILSVNAYPDKPLVYLDSAASSQKPKYVLQVMDDYYKLSHSNVHRGAHSLAIQATDKYEKARDLVKTFINANKREEIIFTRGATEAINLVAQSYGETFIKAGDEIILSVMEHHSNLVPWQMLAKKTGAILKFVKITDEMEFDFDHFKSLLTDKTKFVSVTYCSNVLGTCNPVNDIIKEAHKIGAKVLLDACQAVPHMPIDVQALDVDFIAASGHKMCGPTGIGFLYGKYDILKSMPPVQGGGEMIDKVELQESTYALPPSRFEAGTPPIAECVGLGAACEYLMKIGMDKIYNHEKKLGKYLYEQLDSLGTLQLYGPRPSSTKERTGLVAFNSATVHATDLSFFLDQEGIAVRTGHHCTQPLHKELQLAGSIRASLYFYNSKEDIDTFIQKLKETTLMFENFNTEEGRLL